MGSALVLKVEYVDRKPYWGILIHELLSIEYRRRTLVEEFVVLDVIPMSVGISYSSRGKNLGSIVNLMYLCAPFAKKVLWHICVKYTCSNNQVI